VSDRRLRVYRQLQKLFIYRLPSNTPMPIDVCLLSGETILVLPFECNRSPGMSLASVVIPLVNYINDSFFRDNSTREEGESHEFTLLHQDAILWRSDGVLKEPKEPLLDNSVLQLLVTLEQDNGRGVYYRPREL